MKKYTRHSREFVDEVIGFYTQKHTVKETAERFDLTINQVNSLVKARKATNGRTISEINKQKAKDGAKKAIAKAAVGFEQKLYEQGFELVGEYSGGKNRVRIKCKNCGADYERLACNITKRGAFCANCQKIEAKRKREEERKANEIERLKRNEERKAEQKAKKEQKEEERLARLYEPHKCKVCGKAYTIADYMKSTGMTYGRDSGFCSWVCRDEQKRINEKKNKKIQRAKGKKYASKHYTRAKRLGLPAEEGVTLKKLIERDGLTCALCGLPCFYGGDFRSDLYPSIDHIIPLNNDPDKRGGHTWENVQVAHRLCNSNKRDLIGEEWNNTGKPMASKP